MSVHGMKSLRGKVRNIRRNLGDEVQDAVQSGARQTAGEAKRNVAQHNTVWRGNLFRSIDTERSTVPNGVRYRIVADVPYAAFVEFGTGARGDIDAPPRFQFGSPPLTEDLVDEIVEWVMTKPVFFGPRTEAVAFAIATKISEEGTHAHPYMRPAWFRMKPQIVQSAGYAARKVVRRA